MTKTIFNLTLPTVASIIEDILETYPHHPYQQAFSIPDLRQELIAHVLSRVSNCYVVVEEGQQSSINFRTLACSLKDRSCIEDFIHQGIEEIMYKQEQKLSLKIPETEDSGLAPSHWFG
ncbi:hypothetical protein QUB80_06635 [Chlorogloeopsis sp. ULAP01]|uniref:hypothetical protein n=1 Tax=Chlorogloeopsis sp. ULAP01 TaxID=3056483 RepID=UPI0025AB2BD2|nr:hypothetical protein [Chlorogloeopsis sp. ULAP01]MDM9380378.1 hypothetical protein [Chlorogloeopsis sp. ULAP01]